MARVSGEKAHGPSKSGQFMRLGTLTDFQSGPREGSQLFNSKLIMTHHDSSILSAGLEFEYASTQLTLPTLRSPIKTVAWWHSAVGLEAGEWETGTNGGGNQMHYMNHWRCL